MTSHEQRGGFVMLHSAAFPVAYVTSMAPLRFFEERRGFLCHEREYGNGREGYKRDFGENR